MIQRFQLILLHPVVPERLHFLQVQEVLVVLEVQAVQKNQENLDFLDFQVVQGSPVTLQFLADLKNLGVLVARLVQ